MHFVSLRSRGFLTAAALALAVSGCTPAERFAGTADRAAVKDESDKAGSRTEGKERSWWERLTQSRREPQGKPWVYGDVRSGKGMLGGDEDGIVLYRQGEAGGSGPAKPAQVRR